jgi:hypothetical protein
LNRRNVAWRRSRRWRSASGLRSRRCSPRWHRNRGRCCVRSSGSRCTRGRRSCGSLGRNHDHGRRPVRSRDRSRSHHSRRRCCSLRSFGGRLRRTGLWRRRSAGSCFLRFCCGSRNWRLRCRARRRRLSCSLLLGDGAEHIARPGNIRQIDLGLDAFFAACASRSSCRTRRRIGAATEMLSHQVRFVVL